MIAKGCPKCEQQVPVACKACPCGHSFFSARKTAKLIAAADVDIRRRTQRVRREKPNYYDSLEFEKQVRKSKTRNSESANDEDYKRENGKSKRKKIRKEDDEDDEIINNLSQAKQAQCSVILDELNRKLQLVTWKPTF